MPSRWTPLPLDGPLWLNGAETAPKRGFLAMENCYTNDTKGISRFWGLKKRCTLPDGGRVYLNEWRGDLLAVTSTGQVFRVDLAKFVPQRVSGVLVGGNDRCIFQPTDDDMLMAAGSAVVAFDGSLTRKLSDDAPIATHVGFLDGYTLANEKGSARWFHSDPGNSGVWDPINVFVADAKPDNIIAILVSPYREIMIFGPRSVEQWERLRSQDVAFFRRYATPASLKQPYALVFANNGTYGFCDPGEVVRISGQTSLSVSDDVTAYLQGLDDISEAWMGGFPDRPFEFDGENFIILQFPNATNRYGTKGVTLAMEYRRRRWIELYGHDERLGLPVRWPGWSHWRIGESESGRTFVGGEGAIYEVVRDSWWHDGKPAVMRFRTHHIMDGEIRIDDLRMNLLRGVGKGNQRPPVIRLRAHRDHYTFTRWIERSLGDDAKREITINFGQMGCARSWQFEVEISGDTQIDIRSMEMVPTRVGF